MIVVIPTYGRVNRQITYDGISAPCAVSHCPYPIVFCIRPSEEYYFSAKKYPSLILPDNVIGIAAARDYIVEKFPSKKVLMLDDDLTFAARRTDDPTRFREMVPADYTTMFHELEYILQDNAHIGMAAREG